MLAPVTIRFHNNESFPKKKFQSLDPVFTLNKVFSKKTKVESPLIDRVTKPTIFDGTPFVPEPVQQTQKKEQVEVKVQQKVTFMTLVNKHILHMEKRLREKIRKTIEKERDLFKGCDVIVSTD